MRQDRATSYYPDLATLTPSKARDGIWDGFAASMASQFGDFRVSCKVCVCGGCARASPPRVVCPLPLLLAPVLLLRTEYS